MERVRLGFNGWVILLHELVHAVMFDIFLRGQKPYIVLGDIVNLHYINGGEEQWKEQFFRKILGYKVYFTKFNDFNKGITDVEDRTKLKPYQVRIISIAPKALRA